MKPKVSISGDKYLYVNRYLYVDIDVDEDKYWVLPQIL